MPGNVTVVGPSTPQLGQSIGKWIQANTVALAETALAEEVSKGFDNQPTVITDGMPRRDYTQVKIGGKIEFVARSSMVDAVLWALDELRKKSPVRSGRYVQSHVVLINDVEVTGNIRVALTSVKPEDRVQIVNPLPYSRKIEKATANKRTGRAHRKALSKQARQGVYQPVLRALVQRYSKTFFFDFKYVKLNTGVKVWSQSGGTKTPVAPRQIIRGANGRITGHTRPGRTVQRDQVYPSLQFYQKPTGLPN